MYSIVFVNIPRKTLGSVSTPTYWNALCAGFAFVRQGYRVRIFKNGKLA